MSLLQKLADLKEAARQAALARDEFVMPEGLSRKEQRTLLARHKRVRGASPGCDCADFAIMVELCSDDGLRGAAACAGHQRRPTSFWLSTAAQQRLRPSLCMHGPLY